MANGKTEERSGESTSLWAGLAVGLGIVAVVGIAGVALYLILRDRSGSNQNLQGFGNPQLYPYPVPYAIDGTPMAGAMTAPTPPGLPRVAAAGMTDFRPMTSTNTRRLPSLAVANSQAIRVAGADTAAMRATLRPIGPPGSFVALSMSPAELNVPGIATTIPTGFTYSIPVGESQVVDLNRGQYLYAKGNTDGVRLSVVTSMVPDGVLNY